MALHATCIRGKPVELQPLCRELLAELRLGHQHGSESRLDAADGGWYQYSAKVDNILSDLVAPASSSPVTSVADRDGLGVPLQLPASRHYGPAHLAPCRLSKSVSANELSLGKDCRVRGGGLHRSAFSGGRVRAGQPSGSGAGKASTSDINPSSSDLQNRQPMCSPFTLYSSPFASQADAEERSAAADSCNPLLAAKAQCLDGHQSSCSLSADASNKATVDDAGSSISRAASLVSRGSSSFMPDSRLHAGTCMEGRIRGGLSKSSLAKEDSVVVVSPSHSMCSPSSPGTGLACGPFDHSISDVSCAFSSRGVPLQCVVAQLSTSVCMTSLDSSSLALLDRSIAAVQASPTGSPCAMAGTFSPLALTCLYAGNGQSLQTAVQGLINEGAALAAVPHHSEASATRAQSPAFASPQGLDSITPCPGVVELLSEGPPADGGTRLMRVRPSGTALDMMSRGRLSMDRCHSMASGLSRNSSTTLFDFAEESVMSNSRLCSMHAYSAAMGSRPTSMCGQPERLPDLLSASMPGGMMLHQHNSLLSVSPSSINGLALMMATRDTLRGSTRVDAASNPFAAHSKSGYSLLSISEPAANIQQSAPTKLRDC